MFKSLNFKVILFGFIFTFFSSFGQSFFLGLFKTDGRALSDITSGSEVQKSYKIWFVQKPDVFLPRCQTSNTDKNEKENLKIWISGPVGSGNSYAQSS